MTGDSRHWKRADTTTSEHAGTSEYAGQGSRTASAGAVDVDDAPAHSEPDERLEDFTLRFAPRSYRTWTTGVVAISALGGIAYLADFAIGANIGIAYGTTNALWGIAVFAVVIFATGLPLAFYACRYNLDLAHVLPATEVAVSTR